MLHTRNHTHKPPNTIRRTGVCRHPPVAMATESQTTGVCWWRDDARQYLVLSSEKKTSFNSTWTGAPLMGISNAHIIWNHMQRRSKTMMMMMLKLNDTTIEQQSISILSEYTFAEWAQCGYKMCNSKYDRMSIKQKDVSLPHSRVEWSSARWFQL